MEVENNNIIDITETPQNSPKEKQEKKRGRPKKYDEKTREIVRNYNQKYYLKNVKNKLIHCSICNKDITPLSLTRHNQSKAHFYNSFKELGLTISINIPEDLKNFTDDEIYQRIKEDYEANEQKD
jgi:hypothetical protein